LVVKIHTNVFYYVLRACTFIEIKDIVRSHQYEKKGEELIKKMPAEGNMYELLLSKLIDELGKNSIVVKYIGVYFYNQFIKLRDKDFHFVVFHWFC
jgi:hypothetical protein